MKRALKVLSVLLLVIVGVALFAAVYVYVASERVLARTYDVPLSGFAAPDDIETIRRGERVATIIGCNNCHGPALTGTIMFDQPNIARITAPNLTRVLKEYTDAELERLLRYGVKQDGTSTWIMPSYMFNHLTDEDLGAVIAYVRSKPERDGVEPDVTLRPLGRVGVVIDTFQPAAEQVESTVARSAPDYDDALSHGRYLVLNACTECHGRRLEGWEFIKAPNLAIAAAYTEQDLAKLLRTGVALGDRKLGLMSKISPVRFAALTDAEIRAMHTFLTAFAHQGGAALP